MKRTKILAVVFFVWVLTLLVILTSNSLAGAAVIAYSWPATIGLGIAIFISYFKDKKKNTDVELLFWVFYLSGVTVVLVFVIYVTYTLFFNFNYK